MNKLNQTLTLKDQRTLSYVEAGDPKGKLISLLHGFILLYAWYGLLDRGIPLFVAKSIK